MKTKTSSTHFDHLVGGLLSGLFSCVLLQPLDLSKTRMQQNPLKISLRATMLDIYKKQGLLALWKGRFCFISGTIPTVLRNVPGSGMYFYSLNMIRRRLQSTNISSDFINIFSGSFSRVVFESRLS